MAQRPLPHFPIWPYGLAMAAAVALSLGALLFDPSRRLWLILAPCWAGVIVAVSVGVHDRRLVRRVRAARGRLCVRCHYTLAGLPAPGACPECGEPYPEDGHASRWVEFGALMRSET